MLRWLLVFSIACGHPVAPTTPAAKRFTVHIDTLVPERAAQFEAARRAWVGVMRGAGASDLRGTFFEVKGVGFVTLRPLGRFAELDARGEQRKRALANAPKPALERYDQLSDEALAFPHTSEIWEIDDDLSYTPAAGGLELLAAPSLRMIVEEVRPDTASEKAYADAWTETRRALAAASYPLTRVTLRSVFGSGRVITLWLAPTAGELAAAPSIDTAVAGALGEARAAELAAAVTATVLRREVHEVVLRRDLSSP